MLVNKYTHQAGVTIIEFIVYFAILVMVMISSVAFMFSLQGILVEYRLETELYRAGSATIEQVVLALRQADSFDAAASVLHPSTAGVLVVAGASEIQFARVGTELQLTIDGASYGDITSDLISIAGFTVYHYDTGIGDMVRVEIALTATVGTRSRSMTFYGGSVLRGALQ